MRRTSPLPLSSTSSAAAAVVVVMCCVCAVAMAGSGVGATFSLPKSTQAAFDYAAAQGTRVFIAIATDCDTAAQLAPTILDTWYAPGTVARKFATAKFVVDGSRPGCFGDAALEQDMVMHMPECSQRDSPIAKVLCMWDKVKSILGSRYTHFLRVHADTYVNLNNLVELATHMPSSKPLFAGMRVGDSEDSPAEDVAPFCLGPAHVITAKLLNMLPSGTEELPQGMLPHSGDRAFSYVVQLVAKVSCMEHIDRRFKWAFMHRYWDVAANGTVIKPMGAMSPPVHHRFYSSFVQAVTVRPLQTPEDMRSLHAATQAMRLPLFHLPIPMPDDTKTLVQRMCVHNPARQYELCGLDLRECPTRAPTHPKTLAQLKAYTVYLPSRPDSVRRATNLTQTLRSLGVTTQMVAGIDGPQLFQDLIGNFEKSDAPTASPSVIGLRLAYLRAMGDILLAADASADAPQLHLFLEDDTILGPGFAEKLDHILRTNERCGQFLSVAPGGALLLGGTVWREGTYPRVSKWTSGWIQIDTEISAQPNVADRICYNAANATYGTFAFVVDTEAVRLMHAWLADPAFAHLPVDHAWPRLADIGVPVRVLNPPLAFPTVTDSIIHTSDKHMNSTYRQKVHRWTFA
ncbi:hypothetical protein PTSG_08729 [Salpingoeca rosetta]|uniref:Uncharacterized protein n=1 Tax=Salpingoeca rosetta (strain ATCC 50818 / BSB-021) TaxID=946362 RepID=F2UKI9_SALR5|nr:uncharacterized protein PTSG_08729 [Salpingoeca rosetta]EGD77638.1 hypothetical protein PTSG_08729 [Salpingoeca rosetta]|eukprot:XP_004990114.1 hypothetical protein PTSG_08729 [Salpingoeca rosetta]